MLQELGRAAGVKGWLAASSSRSLSTHKPHYRLASCCCTATAAATAAPDATSPTTVTSSCLTLPINNG
ncbi:hypothetical protein E2C01_042245 [Portunus trituberculatus]|uniref:Uncharacterized protein n=1 Tax=Portunus trituberculatus TaxID=210409 RepID=A0A5B7FPP2_PORTR|nr:hypothetical protein [Portunus trituberculatus]